MRVLIVDDNTGAREMLRVVLKKLKHEVAGEAGDGDSALRTFAELRPEVVLLDIIMPGKSGVEVMDEMLKIDPAVKVIVITAANQDAVRRDIKAKAAAVIYKPFSWEELETAFKLL